MFHIRPLHSGTRLNFGDKTVANDILQVGLLSGYDKYIADLKDDLTLIPKGIAAVVKADAVISPVVTSITKMMHELHMVYYKQFGFSRPDAVDHAWKMYSPVLERLINLYLDLYQIDRWIALANKGAKVTVS